MSVLRFKNFTKTSDAERKLILDWRNSDRIRTKMINQEIIPLENHLRWVDGLSKRNDCLYFLVYVDDTPIAVLDFTSLDFDTKTGAWGFYSDEKYVVYFSLIEAEMLRYFFNTLGFHLITAQVLESNKRIYENHKKYFNFKDDERYSSTLNLKDGNIAVFGLSLSKGDWEKRDETFEKRLLRMFSIKDIIWD